MTSLREEVGLQPDPEFDLQLPPGWTRQEVSDRVADSMLATLRRRMMEQHRPDAFVQLEGLLRRSFAEMERDGVLAFFSPTEEGDSTLAIPASIHASIRRAEPGESLDDLARALIQGRGATPLLGDPRTLRFEQEKTIKLGESSLIAQSIIYLTPIPGAKRRRALQLVAGFGRTVDTPPDHPVLEATRLLFDACVSTLTWRPPATA